LRPLRVTDAERDYAAVMASAEQLRAWSQASWPEDDFTLEQNREDLRRHEREHGERVAFTFTVLDPTGAECLGGVYFQPLRPEAASLGERSRHVASVSFWVRTEEVALDLDRHLLETLRAWLAESWRFDRVVFTVGQRNERQAS